MDEPLNAGNGFGGSMGGGMAQPRFFPGAWGSCSTSCGPGVRSRTVECVAFQGITGSVIKLPEYECEGERSHERLLSMFSCIYTKCTPSGSPKPPLFEPCQLRQCPLAESGGSSAASAVEQDVRPRGFRWEYGDWAACSASCLGGTIESRHGH